MDENISFQKDMENKVAEVAVHIKTQNALIVHLTSTPWSSITLSAIHFH